VQYNYQKEQELSELSNDELLQFTVNRSELTPLELELFLRLEQYVALYGDYLSKAL
jgi:hypothetical protein